MNYSKAVKSEKNNPSQPQSGSPRPSLLRNAPSGLPGPNSSNNPSDRTKMGYSAAAKSPKLSAPSRSPKSTPQQHRKFQKMIEPHMPSMRPEGGGSQAFNSSRQIVKPTEPLYQRPLRPPPTFGADKNQPVLRKIEEEKLTDEAKRKFVKDKLNRSESPFIWKPYQVRPYDNPETNFLRVQFKTDEIQESRPFKWRHFILGLVMSYELFRMGEVDKAVEKIKGLESLLMLGDSEGTGGSRPLRKDWMFGAIRDALWHVVYCSLAFLHFEKNELDEAYKMASAILPWGSMKKQAKAGMHGIRAAVSMEFGHRGNRIACAEASKAIEIDTTIGEWHFLFAKSMARLRRVSQCHDEVDPLETKAIGKALHLSKENPEYSIHNAHLIRERAFRLYSKNPFQYKLLEVNVEGKSRKEVIKEKKENRKKRKEATTAHSKLEEVQKVRKLYLAARYRYHEALNLQPDNARMLIRVAFGLMKMPEFFVDLKLIRECIEKATSLAPYNPMVHHVRGLYFERFHTDADQVVEALEKASSLNNFGAAIDLIKVNYKLKQTNILEQLLNVADRFNEPEKQQVVFAHAGSYMLFIKKDLLGAIKYYGKVLDTHESIYALKSHKPLFFWVKKPLNMLKVMKEEIGNRTELNSFPDEQKALIRKFRLKLMPWDDEGKDGEGEGKDGKKEEALGVQEILTMAWEGQKHLSLYKERQKRRDMRKRPKRMWTYKEKKKKESSDRNKENERANQRDSAELRNFQSKRGASGEKPRDSRSSWNRDYRNSRGDSSPSRDSVASLSSVDSDYVRDKVKHGNRFSWGSSGCVASASPSLAPDNSSFIARNRRDSSASSVGSDWHCSDSSASSASDCAMGPENSLLTQGNLMRHDSQCRTIQRQVSRLSLDEPLPRELTHAVSLMSLDDCSLQEDFEKLSVKDRVVRTYANMEHLKNNPLYKSESSQSVNKECSSRGRGRGRGGGGARGRGRGETRHRSSTQSLNVERTPPDPEGYHSAFGGQLASFMPSYGKKKGEEESL